MPACLPLACLFAAATQREVTNGTCYCSSECEPAVLILIQKPKVGLRCCLRGRVIVWLKNKKNIGTTASNPKVMLSCSAFYAGIVRI